MPTGWDAEPRRVRIAWRDPELSLVVQRLERAGWEVTDQEGWDLLWTAGEPTSDQLAGRTENSWVNHLPGIGVITRKDRLWLTTEHHRFLLARRGYEFPQTVPTTYLMPPGWAQLQAAAQQDPGSAWIQKPRASARGVGISVLDDAANADSGPNWLVQRYVRPHLLDGRKYSLRWYVLIASLDPLRAYVFDDGFAKLASHPFSGAERSDRLAHLTNPDVQAANPDLAVSADNLTHGGYARRLQDDGTDSDALFRDIRRLLGFVVAAAREPLSRAAWAGAGAGPAGHFELLGFDILIDEDLRPWVAEVNLGPSLTVEAGAGRANAEETSVKTRLVDSVLVRVGLVARDRVRDLSRDGFEPLPVEAEWLSLPRPAEAEAGPPAFRRTASRAYEFSDGLVVQAGQDLHLFDPPASFIWSGLEDGLSTEDIIEEMAQATPGAAWRVEADVRNTLAMWAEAGLLVRRNQWDPPAGPPGTLPDPSPAWGPGGVYEVAGVRVGVQLPSTVLGSWVESALGQWRVPLPPDANPAVHARVHIVAAGKGWSVSWEGGLLPDRRDRQVGASVREAVSELVGARLGCLVVRATLLERRGRSVLITGPVERRAAIIKAWTGERAGRCLADDLAVWADGSFLGVASGIEEPWSGDWLGPLPGPEEEGALHGTLSGELIRYYRPDVEPAPTRPDCFLRLVSTARTGPEPMPSAPRETLGDLLGARLGPGISMSEVDTRSLLELVETVRGYRSGPSDPADSVGSIRALLES